MLFSVGDACFLCLGRAPFSWTYTCFLDLAFFFGPGGKKNVGNVPVCFLDPVGIFFFGPACICAGPRDIFWDSQINCYWAWFLFFGPAHLLRGPCLHRVGGKLHCYRRSHWAGCFWTLAPSFFELVHVFLDLAQGGGNLDIETRCMQEVVDAGEVRILKQQKRKRWRGQWGKSTYEAQWMQEIERHKGGRESSILKQDESKKLLRDEGWSLDTETKWRYMKIHAKKAERGRGRGNFWDPKMNAGSSWEAPGGRNLDIETGCMQEGVERNRGTCRYWNQVTAENWWERGRWERGKLDIETRMNARNCWDEKRKSRYWTQNDGACKKLWRDDVGKGYIETAWMREAVERHRWGGL